MANARPMAGLAGREVRGIVSTLRARNDALVVARAQAGDWRRLQFDAVNALVAAQRAFVQVHSEIIDVLRSDRALYSRLRIASIELTFAIDELRELIRHVERNAAMSH